MGKIESAGVVPHGALVDTNGNLHTFSVTESEDSRETDAGNAYNLNTGDISVPCIGLPRVLRFSNRK